jgi:DNA-binding transcriptional MocR family regulator
MISLRSELRRNLLAFFYSNRSARVYVRQLAAAIEADSTNVSRELARLEQEGLLQSETEGRQLYYSINRGYPYLKPVFALLQSSVGIQPTIKHALQAIPGIRSGWLFGPFAKNRADTANDTARAIGLLLVGKPDQQQLASEITKTEKILRREIKATVLTPKELKRHLKKHDKWVTEIWHGMRIGLIDEDESKAAKAAKT